MLLDRRTVVLVALAGSAVPASGVTGPTAAPVTAAQDAEFWYVGRVQDHTTPNDQHLGTGSYIRQGVVLTAGHVINGDRQHGVAFEQFQLGGTRYFGLGVMNPAYNPAGAQVSGDDNGLILLLNGRASQVGEAFPLLADAGGAHALAQGQSVEVIGFTGPGGTSAKRRGVLSLRDPHAGDITPNMYSYRAAGTDSTQPGDSGGPHVHDFGGAIGKRIVATTQSGNGAGVSSAVRVDAHRSFIDGDGVGGKRVITKFAAAGNVNWTAGAAWARGSTGAAAVPAADDVVVLDPSVNADRGQVVTVSQATANIDGLLNDVTLDVSGGSLRVAAADGVNSGTGALNGGVIKVSGDGNSTGYFTVGTGLENRGEIRVEIGGEFQVGVNSVQGFAPVSLLNGEGALIEVNQGGFGGGLMAKMTSYSPTENRGTIKVGTKSLVFLNSRDIGSDTTVAFNNATAGSVLEVSGEEARLSFDSISTNSGEMRVSSGGLLRLGTTLGTTRAYSLIVRDGGKVNVQSGGTMDSVSHLDRRAAVIGVGFGGQMNITGGAAGNGVLRTDGIESFGKTSVGSGGRLNATRVVEVKSQGEMTVEGGAAGTGVVTAASLVTERFQGAGRPGGSVTVKKGGFINAGRTALDPVGWYSLESGVGSTIHLMPGGRLTVRGFGELNGDLKISSGADGIGLALLGSDFEGNKTEFTQQTNSRLEFVQGGNASKPQLVTENAAYINRGTILGDGQFVMTGDTRFDFIGGVGPVTNPDLNLRGIDFVWDGARTGTGGRVTMEIFGQNRGAVPEGLTSIWGANMLCVLGGSQLKLVDLRSNDGALNTEAIYVKYFGVGGAGTSLDLNDRIVYYEQIDPNCGLNPSLISAGPNGLGRYIQIPAPGWMGLGLVGLVAAGRRRRVAAL